MDDARRPPGRRAVTPAEDLGMHPFARSVIGLVAGLIVGVVVISIFQFVNILIFPLPEGVDPSDTEALKAVMRDIAPHKLIGVLVAYTLGVLAGSATAARIAGRSRMAHAMVIGVLLLAGAVMNLIMIPHPVWFAVLAVLIPLPAAWLAARLAGGAAA
jgi:predicted MFS family arabinose efflux permease